jgi:hypothetical protein
MPRRRETKDILAAFIVSDRPEIVTRIGTNLEATEMDMMIDEAVATANRVMTILGIEIDLIGLLPIDVLVIGIPEITQM